MDTFSAFEVRTWRVDDAVARQGLGDCSATQSLSTMDCGLILCGGAGVPDHNDTPLRRGGSEQPSDRDRSHVAGGALGESAGRSGGGRARPLAAMQRGCGKTRTSQFVTFGFLLWREGENRQIAMVRGNADMILTLCSRPIQLCVRELSTPRRRPGRLAAMRCLHERGSRASNLTSLVGWFIPCLPPYRRVRCRPGRLLGSARFAPRPRLSRSLCVINCSFPTRVFSGSAIFASAGDGHR
jgi:hypothetical protein